MIAQRELLRQLAGVAGLKARIISESYLLFCLSVPLVLRTAPGSID